ncbi:transmembrane sensor [Variovorax sp. TBS-050B]|uniref:FecR family protein n=1 Tax=Variovorax sp. TBS-050B TaxID=2940551 RepID=UPI002475370F|nr:FecR domain-containing protein [Variovorax sp. TBS-050B]MDH6593368.1 transmembrane sensor [Variovorax sp. TBS-050B]
MRPAVAPRLPSGPEPSAAVLEQAAGWYARLRDGRHGARHQEAWLAWLQAAEEHRIAWRYIEEIRQGFDPLQQLADRRAAADVLTAANARMHTRRNLLAGAAAFAGAGLLGALAWREERLPSALTAWSADHRTATGEQAQIALADGSRLWLNTATAVNVDAGSRRIVLVAGEVFVATSPDPSRPFLLRSVHGDMRALGARFNVLREARETRCTVFEGAVEIRTADSGAARTVRAGEQACFGAQRIVSERSADLAREAWTRGLLVADNISLREVVHELRRYRSGYLGLADGLGDLTVYGSFPVLDTDRVLRMLASALPIRIEQPMPWWTRIEPAG